MQIEAKYFTFMSYLLILQAAKCMDVASFLIDNGSVIKNKNSSNENYSYEVKCNTGYILNSNSAVIKFDFVLSEWKPARDYLIQNTPLCARICKLKVNDDILIDESNQVSQLMKHESLIILKDLKAINLKCKSNDTVVKTVSNVYQPTLTVTCNNELRQLAHQQKIDYFEYKCSAMSSFCNVNYLLNFAKAQPDIGKFYPLNPKNPYYINRDSIRLYCNTENNMFVEEFNRKVVLFDCFNSSWYVSAKNERVTSMAQLMNECVLTQDQIKNTKYSNLDFYLKKNFRNLLNLKLNLKLFLIILLISSLLIIIFLMFLLIVTFYKRYRMNNYYRCFMTSRSNTNRHESNQHNGQSRFLNRIFRRSSHNNRPHSRRYQSQLSQTREDQITFSIGSSSSLNNQNVQNINLPTYDEVINKPIQEVQQPQPTQQTQSNLAIASPPSPPPSFSAVLKENNNNLHQSRVHDNIDSQSNYSSISAASALLAGNQNTRRAKQLRFNHSICSQNSKNNYQYYQPNQQQLNQQQFFDSNETFSLNSGFCINSVNACGTASIVGANSYNPSEICTIITNSSMNSAESNASKFVLTGSIENNIDQTSLFNYSTSISEAIALHNEVEPLLSNQSDNENQRDNLTSNANMTTNSNIEK